MNVYESNGQKSSESPDERRSEWERFTMVVLNGDGGGYINVRNDSYDDANSHIHTVHVENGQADGCSCPHALYRDAHCKHQIAVENRPLVLSSADAASASPASTGQQVATDGGAVVETDEEGDTNDDPTESDDAYARPQTDHWGNAVEHFDDGPVGAGEKCECQSCGSRFEIALIAATAENNRNWEEFYECQQCGARGSFRFYGESDRREWTGSMDYPEETH